VFLKIEETFRVAAPLERVWRVITDPEQVGPCIPGCQGIEVTGPTTYRASVKLAIGPIKTTFNVDVELTEERPPNYAASVSRGEEGGKASMLTAKSELRLVAVDAGETEVTYNSDISLSGRLGKYGLGIMKKKAKSYGEQFAVAFSERAEASE
jgi:hypothetical protein